MQMKILSVKRAIDTKMKPVHVASNIKHYERYESKTRNGIDPELKGMQESFNKDS